MKAVISVTLMAVASAFALTADAAPQKAPDAAVPIITPASPASAASKPALRVPTVAEAAEKAVVPGELRPENPVVPQLQIPLRRDAGQPVAVAASNGRVPVQGGIDDGAARCQALANAGERAACQAKVSARK